MAKTNDIVTLIEGNGKNKIVYHYTEESIKKFVKDELVGAIEAGEKSPFMRLLHIRKGNLNYVKKDCTEAILDKIEECKERVKTDKDVVVDYIAGGYEVTIKGIIDDAIDSLMTNVNFAKKMIKENPIQVIELGIFKDYINTDDKMFVLLFNSLIESNDSNASKLADKLYNKHIANDYEKLMLVAKNPKAEKYVASVLEGENITNKTQYAKFARVAVKNNPAVLNSIDPKKLAPTDILAVVKMNIMATPSVVNLLTYLDDKTAKKYLKSIIKYSNEQLKVKLAEAEATGDKEKLTQYKNEAKAYLTEFRSCAMVVANYIEGCELYVLEEETHELNRVAENEHSDRVGKINDSYKKFNKIADENLDDLRRDKYLSAYSSITEDDYAYALMAVSRDLGLKSFEKDESDTFKTVLKEKINDIDEKFPKDVYPENNKKLKRAAVRETFKDLLSGNVRTKLTQKMYNASLQKREKLAKKLTDERIEVLIDERYADLIKEFEIKYNDVLNERMAVRDKQEENSRNIADKQIEKNENARIKKSKKLYENKMQMIGKIESEDNLGL